MEHGIITNATDWRSQALQGRCKFQGLPISIENERGSYRQGKEPNGRIWRTFMAIKYGYIRATESLGVDGDYVDCYIGPNDFSELVFIIHQQVPETKAYDEDKVMLGFNSAAEAKAAYLRQYDRPGFFGSMEEHDMLTFKQMLKDRKGMKLKKSILERNMKTKTTEDRALESGFDKAIDGLREILGGGQTVGKSEVLEKAREAVRAGKLDIVEAGNIEGRVNHNVPLSKAHRASLGLGEGAKIEGLNSPQQSAPAARMGGRGPGRPAAKVDMGTGSSAPVNPVVETMLMVGKVKHTYQAPNGEVMTVTGAEILLKCQELVRSGAMDLITAGDLERGINSGLPIRPEVLRRIFA